MKDRFPRLPPGVTPSDIDEHFGAPDYNEYGVDVTLTISLLSRGKSVADAKHDTERQMEEFAEETEKDIDFIGWEIEDVHKL